VSTTNRQQAGASFMARRSLPMPESST
jgi:hypothetical protein